MDPSPDALPTSSSGEGSAFNTDAGDPEIVAVYTGQDFVALDASRMGRTSQGGLKGPAVLTKVGIFNYRHKDGLKSGQIVREYRPAAEVFAVESLATLEDAPLTDFHPAEGNGLVSPENFTTLSKGHVRGITHDETKVTAEAIVQDGAMAKLVLDGKRVELSCGYRYRRDWTPGEFNGQPYDLVQRNIQYNHVALLPRGGGRQGPDVALCFDSVILRESDMIITFDGKDYDLEDEAQRAAYTAAVQAKALLEAKVATDALDATLATERTARASAEAARDIAVAELAPMKAAQAVAVRAELETRARKHLGKPDHAFDSKLTDRQIREQVLTARGVKNVEKAPDASIEFTFDSLAEIAPLDDPALRAARDALNPGGSHPSLDKKQPHPLENRWREPLAASKDRK